MSSTHTPPPNQMFTKINSEPTQALRKFSESEMFKKEIDSKLVLKPRKTHVSSRQIDIIDLFSNNVISERIRKDPREAEDTEEIREGIL